MSDKKTVKASRISTHQSPETGNLIIVEYPVPDSNNTDGIFIRVLLRHETEASYLFLGKDAAIIVRDHLDKYINLPEKEVDDA